MVKIPHLPAVGVVALGALFAQAAVVNVILGVASTAFLRCLIEPLGGMTLAAGHNHMQSHEWIFRLIVVEVHFEPLCCDMTLLAFPAQRAAVRLVGPVAIDALGAE